MNDTLARPAGLGRPLALLALVVGIAAVVMIGIGGPGTRMGWWEFRFGFKLMRWGAYAGIAAMVLAVIAAAAARRGGRGALVMAVVALLLGGAAFLLPWSWRRHARGVPPIHDITTDFANPPELTASRVLRDTTPRMNTWIYQGDSIGKQQRAAYPDIRPVMLAMTPDEAYRAVLRTAQDMGWEILAQDAAGRRVEALDETKWYGFKDDVSLRVTPASGIARVDIRSVSRVGGSDVGMNATRIRKYVAKLREGYGSKFAEEN
jgi:uncharacterized protein (DUF1499 family)